MTEKMLDRRFEMCNYILRVRVTHYKDLMDRFGISKPTAVADVEFISKHLISIETQDGKAGYIKALDSSIRTSLVKLGSKDAAILYMLKKCIEENNADMILENKEQMLDIINKVMTAVVMPA